MHRPHSENLREPAGLAQLAQAKRGRREANDGESQIAEVLHPRAPQQPAVSPLQFRLRTMLAVVAALSGLFAVMQVVGAVWSAILVWFLLLAMAHVTANFWGTRVAPGVGRRQADEQPEHGVAIPNRAGAIGAVRLSESLRPGWPMLVTTTIGALVGGALSSVALLFLSLDRAGYAGVVVGAVSAAVVGGFLGFLTSSFAEIALRAWREALSTTRDPRAVEENR